MPYSDICSMKKIIQKYKLEVIGIPAGMLGGWLYWYYVGCTSGSCAITSSPVNSTLYGAVLGALLFGMFKKETKNNKRQNEHEYRNLN